MATSQQANSQTTVHDASTRPTSNKLVVVAIDVGTAYSGYAFSYRSRPQEVFVNNWESHAGDGLSYKAPSSILLNETYDFVAFGYDAEKKFTEIVQNNYKDKFFFVKDFKTQLANDQGLERHLLVKDILKRFVPAHGLFMESIRFLRKHFLEIVNKKGFDYDEDDIHYILTIPAIWSDVAKQIMRDSACMAGIKPKNLELAFEPEVAALHCRAIPSENLSGSTKELEEMFKPGIKFAVLDLGGGTADMTIEQNTLDGKLKHVHKATGGLWGGNNVNQEFFKFISDVIGNDIFQSFVEENLTDFFFLSGQFETKKRYIGKNTTEKIVIQLPVSFVEIIMEKTYKTLAQTIKGSIYNKDIDVEKGRLAISAEKFRSFFKRTIQGILTHVKTILNKRECKDVKYILMVGGFSESPLVRDEMQFNFPDKKIINPVDAGLSVLKGAVLYGLNTETVTARASPLTYGISLYDSFNEKKHDFSKTVKMGNERIVLGCFEKFFTINELVEVGTKRSISVYESYEGKSDDVRTMSKEIEIFSSYEENPKYVTEESCSRHGRIIVSPPNGRWPDKVKGKIEFEFGGTELMVRYIDKATQYEVTGSVDFHQSDSHFDLLRSSVQKQ